jgi:hypothetical protein
MPELSEFPKRSLLQRILIEGRKHWDHDGYDPDCRARFLRTIQCKTPEMGQRIFASENEERMHEVYRKILQPEIASAYLNIRRRSPF